MLRLNPTRMLLIVRPRTLGHTLLDLEGTGLNFRFQTSHCFLLHEETHAIDCQIITQDFRRQPHQG